jgi:holliday junction resolvase YEN1
MTAQCLAQSKLATSLFVASTSLSRHDLPVFLVNWREKLSNQLIYDPNGLIGRKNPSLAKRIPESFPDINVLQLYANPITSWTIGDGPDISHWRLGEPNLAQIAVLWNIWPPYQSVPGQSLAWHCCPAATTGKRYFLTMDN